MSTTPSNASETLEGAVLNVRSIGSFHIGGQQRTVIGAPPRDIVYSPGHAPVTIDPNGAYESGQMYVQFVHLQRPKARHKLLLMHGGGLCGTCWETTPDGRPGWQMRFLEAGHDVHVVDAAECGRASWSGAESDESREPMFRTKAETWELFRIGPEGSWDGEVVRSLVAPGQRFPVEAFDRFMKQAVPRWVGNDEIIQSACDQLAESHGPYTVIAHSRGCNFALRMAIAHPDQVRALVLLEPSGHPDPAEHDLSRLSTIPMLTVWGDHFATHTLWRQLRRNLDAFHQSLRALGARVDEIDLPAHGIHGNSHMLMMDRNSDAIAQRIQGWFESRSLMR